MATISGFESAMNFGGAKLVDGRQYEIELIDIKIKTKVVSYRESFKGLKGVSGVEYDKLTPDNKKLVDDAPVEYWEARDGKEPAPKDKFENRITFQFREPESDTKSIFLQYKMKENGYPSKDLREFVVKSTGITEIDDGFKWGDVFAKGDKFVATVKSKDGGNLYEPEKNTVFKKELAAPIVSGSAALGQNENALLDFIKRELIGKNKGEIVSYFKSGANGTIGPEGEDPENAKARYNNTFNAWTNIRKSGIKYTVDGKNFGFEE